MINDFCRLLSNGILFTNAGYNDNVKYKPCCHFSVDFEISSKEQFDINRKNISSINRWTPYCNKCKKFEDSGVDSARIRSNEEIKSNGLDIEIQIDNSCNAACITCNEWLSTTWKKYNNKINKKPTFLITKPRIENNLLKIIEVLDFENIEINSITFYGGEPFSTDTHIKILSLIPDEKSKDIELSYNTNGSYQLNDSDIDILKKFKSVDISFSLDGIITVFEYHRWPLIWKNVENNFDRTLNLEKIYNFNVDVGSTLTPLNIFYFKDLEDWLDKKSKNYGRKIILEFWPAFGVMSLSSVNIEYRNKLLEMYSNNKKMIGYINSQPFEQKSYDEFLKHLSFHDIHRNLDWRKTFPEVAKFYDK